MGMSPAQRYKRLSSGCHHAELWLGQQVGSIEKGKFADIIAVSEIHLPMLPRWKESIRDEGRMIVRDERERYADPESSRCGLVTVVIEV